jgi:histone-lysine N-methyltransferase ASH1L
MRNAEAVIQAKKEKNEKGPAWTGWADLNDRAVIEQLKREKEARDEAAKNSDRARRMALRRGEEVPPPPTPKAPEPAPKPTTESKKPARYDSRRNTSGSTVKTQKSTIRRVPSSVASVRPGARDNEDLSTTPAKRPGQNRTLSAVSATRRRPTSSGSATTALLERAISADFNEDEFPTPIGNRVLERGDFTTAGAVADVYDGPETEKTETIATSSSKTTTKSKKRKLGNMLKDVAGAVGIGRGNKRAEAVEASSSNRTPGKLKQSTLSFSKMI